MVVKASYVAWFVSLYPVLICICKFFNDRLRAALLRAADLNISHDTFPDDVGLWL